MKHVFLILGLAFAFACDSKKSGENNQADRRNSEENVVENSGENISPQLEYDSANRTDVDTVSTPAGADKQVE